MSANKVFLNDDDIVEIHVVGDQTHDSVMAMGAATEKLLTKLAAQNKIGLILDDITALGATDTAARQTVSQLARTLPFAKTAMVGDGGKLIRVGTEFLLQAIGMGSKIKYFENRDDAIKWLKS